MKDLNTIIEAIKVFDDACDGNVILTQNDNAMDEAIICFRDKELYEKVAQELGLKHREE